MKIKLNIGLENNPLTQSDITKILWINGFYNMKSRVHNGTYLGKPERTLVIEARYIRNEAQFIRVIEALCLMLTQDCIAAVAENIGSLVYDPNFTGEFIEFDKDYFVNY